MIKIIAPIGFCFGVNNSINTVNNYFLSNKDKNIVFLRKIVHDNNTFNKILSKVNGQVYDPNFNYDYKNTTFIFSAHGIIQSEKKLINNKKGIFVDTTCPILLNTKKRIYKYMNEGIDILFIGKKNHDETLSFLSEFKDMTFIDIEELNTFNYKSLNKKYYVVFQSTISLNLYNAFIKKLEEFNIDTIEIESICRQCLLRWKKATSLILNKNDCFIVLGSNLSSNGKEFYNLLLNKYPANHIYFIQDILALNNILDVLKNYNDIYVVSATSFSNDDVDLIINKLKESLNLDSLVL